ncbi:carbohydrate kinase family protein [Neobacillus sp. PS2-9]|uniref:carbohydrate kinase family protein n=1 Tax=Neobacillus sp. PS2-9 TaxID=3070676 RepID=UPI0027E17E9C|nr:carbohydrate kinase family protein [Neobacillus sp. PS2-9]WML58640.1 carbohydrate kinase family protein [Neobacillus sp. PS2-9]
MINLIGCLTADLILAQVKDRPDFGEEHMVDDMIIRPGALANTIFPLAQLGVKQNVISSLGKDEFGEKIYQELQPLIVDSITRTDIPTALSVSVVNHVGSRYFVTYGGNLFDFTKEIVEKAPGFEKARATMFYGYFLIPNFGVEAAADCLRRARSCGQITFFDANSAIDGWSEKSRQEIISLLPYIDYFMPNDEELLFLTGLDSIEESIKFLMANGAKQVVVKRGSKGASLYRDDEALHHEGYPTTAYDTTGAGDSFNAGFIYKLLNGGSFSDSLACGNALASIVVSRKENRYPEIQEIEERIKV